MTSHPPVPEGQERREAIEAATAFGRRYEIAQMWRGIALGIGLALPVLGSILVLADSEAAVALGAISGSWAVLGRYGVEALEARFRREGACAQEVFDCLVLGLGWNEALAGPTPAPEDICDWAGKRGSEDRHGWYAEEVAAACWPLDALLCQRANVVWGRRNHDRYAYIAAALALALFLATVGVGITSGLSLSDYLVRLGLPSLPALLIAGELFSGHRTQARSKQKVELAADGAWSDALASCAPVDPERCRELQDTIFETRASGNPIPKWYYRLRLNHDEGAMREAIAAKVAELPPSLRRD